MNQTTWTASGARGRITAPCCRPDRAARGGPGGRFGRGGRRRKARPRRVAGATYFPVVGGGAPDDPPLGGVAGGGRGGRSSPRSRQVDRAAAHVENVGDVRVDAVPCDRGAERRPAVPRQVGNAGGHQLVRRPLVERHGVGPVHGEVVVAGLDEDRPTDLHLLPRRQLLPRGRRDRLRARDELRRLELHGAQAVDQQLRVRAQATVHVVVGLAALRDLAGEHLAGARQAARWNAGRPRPRRRGPPASRTRSGRARATRTRSRPGRRARPAASARPAPAARWRGSSTRPTGPGTTAVSRSPRRSRTSRADRAGRARSARSRTGSAPRPRSPTPTGRSSRPSRPWRVPSRTEGTPRATGRVKVAGPDRGARVGRAARARPTAPRSGVAPTTRRTSRRRRSRRAAGRGRRATRGRPRAPPRDRGA